MCYFRQRQATFRSSSPTSGLPFSSKIGAASTFTHPPNRPAQPHKSNQVIPRRPGEIVIWRCRTVDRAVPRENWSRDPLDRSPMSGALRRPRHGHVVGHMCCKTQIAQFSSADCRSSGRKCQWELVLPRSPSQPLLGIDLPPQFDERPDRKRVRSRRSQRRNRDGDAIGQDTRAPMRSASRNPGGGCNSRSFAETAASNPCCDWNHARSWGSRYARIKTAANKGSLASRPPGRYAARMNFASSLVTAVTTMSTVEYSLLTGAARHQPVTDARGIGRRAYSAR